MYCVDFAENALFSSSGEICSGLLPSRLREAIHIREEWQTHQREKWQTWGSHQRLDCIIMYGGGMARGTA